MNKNAKKNTILWKPKPIDVSIITVNYNGFEDTCQMIESIRKYIRSVVYEIIVVDNASIKNEASLLRKKYPFIKAIRSSKNIGFACGNNLGVTLSSGKYLFFLNNDTFVKDDNIHFLIERLESELFIGGVSPMLRYTDEDELIQFAGFTPLSRYTLRNKSIGNGEYIGVDYMQSKETPYLHGAAMMVKREVYEQTGGMPSIYFLYYEELDWSMSIRACGYKLWYEPQCMIYHKESRSTGLYSPLKAFYLTRNRFLFAYRNYSRFESIISHLYFIFCVTPKDCFKYLIQRKYKLIRATILGILAYYVIKKNEKIDDYEYKFSYFVC